METILILSVILLLHGTIIARNEESEFSVFDLGFIKSMHESHCILKPFCSPPEVLPIPSPIVFENGTIIIPGFLPDHVSFLPNPPPSFWNDGSCCQDCSCDLELCMLSGTCCPDLLAYLPSVEESATRIQRECRKASLKKSRRLGLPQGLLIRMFTKCPDDFSVDSDVKQKCENPEQYSDWDTLIPVADRERRAVYFQNAHCAECHNVTNENRIKFKASLECSKGELLPSSIENIIDDVKDRSDCNIIYADPLTDEMDTCDDTVIKECNVTGNWQEYNPVTEAACHAYTAVYDNKYNNIFCHLCNEPRPYELPRNCVGFDDRRGLPSFSALLQFTDPSERLFSENRVTTKCNETQIYDNYSDICRDLYCRPPKGLQDGRCVDIVDYLTGVAYEAFLKLVPDEIITTDNVSDIAVEVWDIYKIFLNDLDVYHLLYERRIYYEPFDDDKHFVKCFILDCKLFFGYHERHSNTFVNALLDLETEERTFTTNTNATYRIMLGYYEVSSGHNNSFSVSNNSQESLVLIQDTPPKLDKTFPEIVLRSNTTLVTKLLGCPAVKLNDKYLQATEEKEQHVNLSYPAGSYAEVNESNATVLYVCSDDFLNIARERHRKQIIKPEIDGKSDLIQGVLSLVCTCISILCLIITLITYGLFTELRTQPGINNIALVSCLLIAQTLFQFGSDQSESIPDWSCQMIGVLIHFFWVHVMLWMNVCCIHMFLVFTSFGNISVNNSKFKQTGIYIAYTTFASAILIAINIVVSFLNTSDIGYGGRMCYIRDYHMVGYVFALPVGLIVTCNLALFVIVVIKMCRMPTVESETRHSRNFFTIYAKLSTLTGLTWIFGFIYFFTGVTVMEYIFIVLNASQGVFLFLAFVCNRRVMKLYKRRVGGNETAISWHLTGTRIQTIHFTNMMYTRNGSS